MLRKSVTPGDLAAQLAASEDRRRATRAAAQAKYEATVNAADDSHGKVRANVIEIGVTRIAQISDLQKELERERLDLEGVVKSA